MNKRQKIIISITGITLVLLILVGLTYAYFLTRIQGNTNTKSISVTTADLRIVYGDGNTNIITKEKIQPGTVIGEKDFTVKNEGNTDTDYIVVIEDVNVLDLSNDPATATTFNSNDFVYTITCTLDKEGNECNGQVDEVLPINGGILIGNNIEVNETQEYTLTVTYKETGIDQSEDMNKSFEARVNIKDIKRENPYSSNTNLLSYNIINNAMNKTNGTELRNAPVTSVAKEISLENEKVLSVTQDDLGRSYYYRGNVTDNYVSFNNMCWRIVRIEGDGSVKLILEDQDEVCSSTMDSSIGEIKGNYGYTLDESMSLPYRISVDTLDTSYKYPKVADYLNGQTSNGLSMNTKLNNWLTTNNIDTTKLKQDTWCLGNKTDMYDENGNLLTISKYDYYINSYNTKCGNNNNSCFGDETYYKTAKRIIGLGQEKAATLSCNNMNDETFNSYIASLSADETVYAGFIYSSDEDYFLNKNVYLGYTTSFRTLSLYSSRLDDNAFLVYNDFNDETEEESFNALSYNNVSYNKDELRPSITLLNTTTVTGDGTISSPYVIN